MRIGEVRLIDFTTHRDTRLEFSEGINIITGPNGSGKSSIIQAIYFALFGRGLYYGKKESLVRHGSRNLVVEVGLDGDKLKRIKRTLRSIETSGVNITSSTALKEYLFRFYNLSPGRFVNTLLIKQGETTSFVDRSPRERLKVYESIMGVDTLRAIQDVASELSRKYRDMLREMDVESLLREMETVQKEMETLKKEVETLEARLSAAVQKKKDVEGRLSSVEKSIREMEEMERKLLILKKRREDAEKLMVEMRDVEDYIRRYEELYRKYIDVERMREQALRKIQLEKDISSLEKMLEDVKKIEREARLYEEYLKHNEDEDIRRMESIISETRKLLDELNRLLNTRFSRANEMLPYAREAFERMRREYEEKRKRLMEMISSRGMLKSTIEEKEKAIEALSSSSTGECPVCGRPLTQEHRKEILERYSGELNELKVRLSKLESSIPALEREIALLEERLGYLSLLDRLEEYSRWIEERREKLNEWKKIRQYVRYRESYEKYRKLTGVMEELERKRRGLKKIGDIDAEKILSFIAENENFYREYTHRLKLREKLKRELESINPQEIDKSIEEVKGRLEAIDRKSIERELNVLRKEMEETVSLISSLRTRISSIRELLLEKERRLEDIKSVYERARDMENRRNFYRDMTERISLLIDELKTLHDRNLKILTWNYFRDFELESYNSVEIETTSSGMDIYATTHSGNKVYVQSMSGGERVALSLAIRMAIARILDIKFRTIIMDEPTAGLDRERINKLGEILQNFVKMNPGSQIILITHEESLAEYANKRFRLNKVGEETFVEEF